MARIANGTVHFSDGDYATLDELRSAGETVSALSAAVSVFSVGDRVVQSDGRAQRAAAPGAVSQLAALEERKGDFMPGIEAARSA